MRDLISLCRCLWTWLGRYRSRAAGTETRQAARLDDAQQNVSVLVSLAQARLEMQSQDWDTHGLRALGWIAADLAGAGLLLTQQPKLHSLWWLPPLGLLLSAGMFYVSQLRRRFNEGPDLRLFYQSFGAAPALEADRQLLSQLLRSVDENDRNAPRRQRWYTWGDRVLIATALITAGLFA